MKKYFLFLSFAMFVLLQCARAQQTSVYTVQDGAGAGSPRLIELDNNRMILIGASTFGYDSSYVKMTWLDNNMNVLNHKEYRMYLPLASVFDAVKTPNGFLFGGNQYTSLDNPPFMFRTDTAGNALRQDYAVVNPDWQEDIAQFVVNQNGTYTAYSATSNVASSSYRIDGNINDTIIRSKRLTAANGASFRPLKAMDANGNGKHYLMGGLVDPNASFAQRVFIMKLDSHQVYWCRQYDFNEPTEQDANNAVKLSNGNIAFVGDGFPSTGSFADGFVSVADTAGNMVWSRKLTIPGGGVYPAAVIETNNHDLLVLGNTHDYKGIVMKFDAGGMLLWKRVVTVTSTPTYFSNAIKRSNGEIWATAYTFMGSPIVFRFDDQGTSCSLANDTTIQSQNYTPIMANDTVNLSPTTIVFANKPTSQRNLVTTSTQLCLGSGINDFSQGNAMVSVFPNPAEDVCHLQSSNGQFFHYELMDVSGRTLMSGNASGHTELNVLDLSSGVYLLRYTVGTQSGVLKLVR